MDVRALTAEDADAFRALRLRALMEHPEAFGATVEETRAQLTSGGETFASMDHPAFGVFSDGGMVGIARLNRYPGSKRRHRVMLTNMYVVPEARGTGAAKALLEGIIRHARLLEGIEDIILAVTTGNEPARRLYMSAGFKPYGVEPRAIRVGEVYHDIEWMYLQLPPLELERFEDVAEFRAATVPFLVRREAEHNLLLGLAARIDEMPPEKRGVRYVAVVRAGDEVVAAAMQSDAHHELIISCGASLQALRLLVEDVHALGADLYGVNGEKPVAQTFAELWSRKTGQSFLLNMAMRVYQLEQVTVPQRPVSGHYRLPKPEERELLIEWSIAFSEVAVGPMSRETAEQAVDARMPGDETMGLRVWEDNGRAVSMAGYARRTPNGQVINFVYTPPEERRKGYAGACVSALSQELLDRGRQYCFLFTDLANPTSNHIYQAIGYQPVGDVDTYRFGEKV